MTSREFLKHEIANGSLTIKLHFKLFNMFSITYKDKIAFACGNDNIRLVLDGICIGNNIQPAPYIMPVIVLSKYSIYHQLTGNKLWIHKRGKV